MAQTSPILRFALEIIHTALENYCGPAPRHRKVAVLNLAQGIELAIKAALVENNVPIYDKGGRTVNTHEALERLAKLWDVERIDAHARIELLVDERNEIQHRYGNVDEVGLDYHMETMFLAMRQILANEFDTGFDAWIRDNVAKDTWQKVRFVYPETPAAAAAIPSAAVMKDRSATVDFIDGFARFERRVREIIQPHLEEGQRFSGSTLDFAMKALWNAPSRPGDLLAGLPTVYKLRNRSVHGDEEPTELEVANSLGVLDRVLAALKDVPEETVQMAVRAAEHGRKGTKLLTRLEEAQEDFPVAPPELPPTQPM